MGDDGWKYAVLSISCLVQVSGDRCAGRRFAVLVSGVADRFLLEPTLRHVVAPAVQLGWCVDYFLQLTRTWNNQWFDKNSVKWTEPVPSPYASMPIEQFKDIVHSQARLYGARHISFRLLDGLPTIDAMTPDGNILRGIRYAAYPLQSELGRNQLRRLKQIEMLWNHTVAYANGSLYDWVLLSRDDVYWVRDVDFDWFVRDRSISKQGVMYTYYCEQLPLNCLNEKVILMSGYIADNMMRMYNEIYYNDDPFLDYTNTVEELVMRTALLHQVPIVQVKLRKLPFYVVQYTELKGYGVTLCLRYTRTFPCVNGSISEVLRGRFGPPCFWDPARYSCMGAANLSYPGCANLARCSFWRYDLRLDYR